MDEGNTLREKSGDSNSYQAGDEINALKWNLVTKNAATRNYFKGLISLRAAHPAFRMEKASDVKSNVKFLKSSNDVIAYSINGSAVGDSWSLIVVIHNASSKSSTVSLPKKDNWNVVVDGKQAGIKVVKSLPSASQVQVPALSTMVIYTK